MRMGIKQWCTSKLEQINWSRLFQSAIGYLWIPIPLIWFIYSGYFHRSISEVFGYLSKDGWCNSRIEGLGVHCFGDFQTPLLMLESGNAWNNMFNSAYTPSALLPHLFTVALDHLGGRFFSLTLALIAISISLLVPAIIVMSKTNASQKWFPMLFLGLGSLPFLMNFDRGNSAALVVPVLVWAVYSYHNFHWYQMSVAVLVATLIRPQFVVLGLLLVFGRKFLLAILTSFAAVLLTVLSFAIWPGNFSNDFLRWVSNTTSYNSYSSLSSDYPLNMSAASSLWKSLNFFHQSKFSASNWASHTQDFLIENPSLVGILLVSLALVVALFSRFQNSKALPLFIVLPLPFLFPGTSYSYYLNFSLVLAALVVISPTFWSRKSGKISSQNSIRGILDEDDSNRIPNAVKMLIVFTLLVSIVPFPHIPLDLSVRQVHFESNMGLFMPYIGPFWFITVLVTCVTYIRTNKAK